MIRSAQVALSRAPARLLDLGTGGGVPGLVFALSYVSAEVTLVEIREIRADFLSTAVRELGLEGRVTVDRRRAEEVGRDPDHRFGYDLISSRSFGPPAVVAECAAPLLADAGVLVVAEPPPDASEARNPNQLRWPVEQLEALGLQDVTAWPLSPGADGVAVVVDESGVDSAQVHSGATKADRPKFATRLLRRFQPCGDRYPRRAGVPNRSPLW